MTGHPIRSVLERFSVADLPEAQAQQTEQHVVSCSSCCQYLEELETARSDRMAAVPPARFVAQVGDRRDRQAGISHRRPFRLGLGILAGAAAAAVLLLVPGPAPRVSLKGAGVTLHRNRAGDVRIIGADDTIRAGDALRIVVTLPRPYPVAAWFVDAQGRVDSVLAETPLLLPAGEQAFPGSVTVDSPCVDLQLVLAVGPSASSQTETTLRQAVAQGIPATDQWLPAGSLTRSLRCE